MLLIYYYYFKQKVSLVNELSSRFVTYRYMRLFTV